MSTYSSPRLYGLPIIQSFAATEITDVPVKIHRKSKGSVNYHERIQKKWVRRFGFLTKPAIFKTLDAFIVHPALMGDLERVLS